MNNEKFPKPSYENPEQIPSQEEIESVFERVIGHEEYEEDRKLEDNEGIYVYEVIVTKENKESELYEYMRKGHYPEGEASHTAVHVTFFDEDNIPVGGRSVAKYIDGEWNLSSSSKD